MSTAHNNHRYDAQVLEVHDGDTFKALVELDFYVRVEIKIRVRDLYAPELLKPGGLDARNAAIGLLGAMVQIQSYKDQQTFARWVCDVWTPDGRSFKEQMDALGYGGQGTGA